MSSGSAFQSMNRPYDGKKDCWVPDAEEGYIEAQIKSTKGDMITVVNRKGNEVSQMDIGDFESEHFERVFACR